MKKIIVFGATGGTGKLVVEQALQAGHHVTVIVRKPETFSLKHERLEILKGDVFQSYTFENALKSIDVVVSCLGIQKREATTIYSDGVTNIMKAMRKNNVSRIICLSAGAVIVPPKGSMMTKFFIKNILQKLFGHLYSDMVTMEKILKESSLDFTIVRPPWLRDTKRTGQYRVAINEHLDNPTKISRADLADYIINNFANERIFKSTVELSY
jgi:putative NADH-flavin reductase